MKSAVNVKKAPQWGNFPTKPGWISKDEILLNQEFEDNLITACVLNPFIVNL